MKFREGVGVSDRVAALQAVGATQVRSIPGTQFAVGRVAETQLQTIERALRRDSRIEYVQPNFVYRLQGIPTDDLFGELWGLHNTGQTIGGITGTSDVDIDAPEAWETTEGSTQVVVAVLDTGVNVNHPDLAANLWRNPGETPGNGVDDDGNGYVDDVYGWDFINDDNSVFDVGDLKNLHGTHVAGTIAALADGSGVVGVAPDVRIMSLKICDEYGLCDTASAIAAITYAKAHGARVVNASWGGTPDAPDQALQDAINNAGLVFVAAAGNGGDDGVGDDNDVYPQSPANLNSPYIISVAAVDNQGNLAAFSNYGLNTVDVAAPGVDILSTTAEPVSAGVHVSGANYKAVYWGFAPGFELIPADFQTAVGQALSFLEIAPTQSILLVDDDNSEDDPGNYADEGAAWTAALTNLGYPNVTTVVVGDAWDGPDAATMSGYDAVIWFTGDAFAAPEGDATHTLTDGDRASLQQYLDGGGRLLLAGSDAAFEVENDPLFTDYFQVQVVSDVGESFWPLVRGVGGSGYAGIPETSLALLGAKDFVLPLNSQAQPVFEYTGAVPDGYSYLDGTSMAAPHVAGVAALVLSQEPSLSPDEVVQRILDNVQLQPALAGLTVTGGLVNAVRSVDVVSPRLVAATVSSATYTSTALDLWFSEPVWSTTLGATDLTVTLYEDAYEANGVPAPVDTVTAQNSTLTAADMISVSLSTYVEPDDRIEITINGSGATKISDRADRTLTGALTAVTGVPPAAPASVQALQSSGGIRLRWDPNTESDLQGYRVYRSTDGVMFSLTEDLDLSSVVYDNYKVVYDDTGLVPGRTYYYVITAYDQVGAESGPSVIVSATAPGGSSGGGVGGGGSDAVEPGVTEAIVTSSPGRATSDDRLFELSFGSGTFEGRQTLQIRQVDRLTPPPGGRILGIGYQVVVDEQPLRPVTIRLALPDDAPRSDIWRAALYRLPEGGSTWEYVGGRIDMKARRLTAHVEGFSTFAAVVYEPKLSDVAGHWAAGPINLLATRRVISGYPDGTFAPERAVTRAEAAKLFVEIVGETGVNLREGEAPAFSDVPAGVWYAGYVRQAVALGLFTGQDGAFRPDQALSREELALAMVVASGRGADALRYYQAGQTSIPFADAEAISPWARPYVAWAVREALLQGVGGNRFDPQGTATRAQVATVLYRLLRLAQVVPDLLFVEGQLLWEETEGGHYELLADSGERYVLLVPSDAKDVARTLAEGVGTRVRITALRAADQTSTYQRGVIVEVLEVEPDA